MKKGIYLNDSIHGLISLTEYEKRIASTIGFNRLHDVYQNSTVYLTFPSNRTKRYEHSVGTMKLCSDMFFHSLLNTTDEMLSEFFEIFDREYAEILEELRKDPLVCEEKLGGRQPERIPKVKLGKLRHSLIPNNVPEKYKVMHLILMESIRAAALLHDIGHPPFSHIVEFALKKVYLEYKDQEISDKQNAKEFLDIMSNYFEGNRKLHEQMGDEISEGILSKIIAPITGEDEEQYEENVFELLVLESVKRIFSDEGAFGELHKILDASLDADRLDYVTRDVLSSGMDVGKIEYSRIINEMQLMVKEGQIYFCVPLKAVNSVEDFIKRRYNSYKDIIYHHRVVKTDFLLEGIVKELVEKYLDQCESEEQPRNEVAIPFDISGLWFPLGDKKSAIKANALSQWNDSWLMTVLKQIYYTEYYHNKDIVEGTAEYILEQRLTEFLRNSKRYYSLIKRSENFKLIDDAVKAELKKNKDELEALCHEETCEEKKEAIKNIYQMLDNTTKGSTGFVLSFVSRNKEKMKLNCFEEMVGEIVKEQTSEVVTDLKIYDTVTLFRRISIGLDAPIYFYNHRGDICTLDDISGISDILQLDSDYLPVFYIYVLAKDGHGVMREKREELLACIGKEIGVQMIEKIKAVLKEDN